MERLGHCIAKLEALSELPRERFTAHSDLRDIAERNFEIAAQCVIDIALRILSVEQRPRASTGAEAILALVPVGVLHAEQAHKLAPIANFRNILVHEYVSVDWDLVYEHFAALDQLRDFAEAARGWLRNQP